MSNNFTDKVVPIKFVLKYSPPIIGLVYKRSQNDQKKRLYEIHLNNLVFVPNQQEVAKQLFQEHPLVLNEKIISMKQVEQLVERIQSKLMRKDNQDDIYANFDENEDENGGGDHQFAEISDDNQESDIL